MPKKKKKKKPILPCFARYYCPFIHPLLFQLALPENNNNDSDDDDDDDDNILSCPHRCPLKCFNSFDNV